MEVLVAASAGQEQMIGVLNHEGVVLAGNEADEELVAIHCFRVAGVEDVRVATVASRHGTENAANEAGLSGAGRPLEHEHGLRRVKVAVDELGNAALKVGVGFVKQVVVGKL